MLISCIICMPIKYEPFVCLLLYGCVGYLRSITRRKYINLSFDSFRVVNLQDLLCYTQFIDHTHELIFFQPSHSPIYCVLNALETKCEFFKVEQAI